MIRQQTTKIHIPINDLAFIFGHIKKGSIMFLKRLSTSKQKTRQKTLPGKLKLKCGSNI